MIGWEVQEMVESARNWQWEEMHDTAADDNRRLQAAIEIGKAIHDLYQAAAKVEEAAGHVENLPEDDKLMSLVDEIDSIRYALEKLKQDMQ